VRPTVHIMLNKVMLIGYVSADSEMKFPPGGIPVTNFSLAAKETYKNDDPRDVLMIGRTIKTTGITVLRADPSKGKDWWVCRCPCSREFVAHGWNIRRGRTRNCGIDEHKVQPKEHQGVVFEI